MLTITRHLLDRTDLVVLAGHGGLVKWSSHRGRDEVGAMPRGVAGKSRTAPL